jgi:hypothetical protein
MAVNLSAVVRDWRRFLPQEEDEEAVAALRSHLRTGLPLGDDGFMPGLVTILRRTFHRRRPAPAAAHKRKRR